MKQQQDILGVRTARASDVPALIALLKDGYKTARASFDRTLLESYPKGTIVFVGYRSGMLVSTAALEPARTEQEIESKLKVPLDQITSRPLPCAVLERVTGEKGSFWSLLPLLCEFSEYLGFQGILGLHPLANRMDQKYRRLGVRIDQVRTPHSVFPGDVQAVSTLCDFQAVRRELQLQGQSLHCRPCNWQAGSVEATLQAWRDDDQQVYLCYR